jgi:hypothetical protein
LLVEAEEALLVEAEAEADLERLLDLQYPQQQTIQLQLVLVAQEVLQDHLVELDILDSQA